MGTLSVDKLLKTSQGAAEFTLPATDGTAGQSMVTDGSGQLSLGNPTVSGIAVSATTLTASGATTLSGAFTSLGIDDNANAIAMTITSSEQIGIGTGAPSYAVHIHGATQDSAVGLSTNAATSAVGMNNSGSTNGVGAPDGSTYLSSYNASPIVLGTNNATRLHIDINGAVTKPFTPAFFAYNGTNVPNATGDNTLYGPIIYTVEQFDQGADYNNITGTFTAPVDGRYFIQAALSTGTQTSSHTDGTFDIITSNKTVSVYYDPGAMEGSAFTGQCTIQSSGVFDMDAGDTATTKIRIAGSTKNIDISTNNTWFSGFLVA